MIEKLNNPDVRKALIKLRGIKNDVGMLLNPTKAVQKYTSAVKAIRDNISEEEIMEFAEFYSDPVNAKDLPDSVIKFFKTDMNTTVHEFAALVSTNWDTIVEFIKEEDANSQQS